MPRSPTILTPPPGILPFVPNTTIRSQDANALFNDLYQDGNTPRPIAYGGTGANNAQDALNNLGAVGQGNFLDAFSIGDFFDTVRTLDSNWLRRNGALYNTSDYPTLSALLPPLSDGVQWSNVTVGATGLATILPLASSSGYIIGREYQSGGNPQTDIYTTTDGDTWSLVATINNFGIVDMAFGGSIYMAADGNGRVATSNDTFTWTNVSASIAGGTSPFTASVAYGAGLFVATAGNSAGNYIFTSTDGSTWTNRYTSSVGLYRVRYVNSTFVAIGDNGAIVTSTDGISWSARTSGFGNTFLGVTYGNSMYVIVGAGGAIYTSSNLTTWTPRTSGTPNQLNDVAYSDAGFMAVGNGGVVRISPADSGTSWVSAGGTGSSFNLAMIAFQSSNPSLYYVVQRNSPSILKGLRTLPTQFQVPNDDPHYGWIKALNE